MKTDKDIFGETMSKFYYKKTIGVEKADYNGNVSIKYVMEVLQKISTSSADLLGFGHELVRNNNLAWVINKIKLEFIRPIKFNETVNFITWPLAPKHFTADRDYLILDENNKTILKGTSVWNLIDLNKRCLTSTEIVKDIKVDYVLDRAMQDISFSRFRFDESYTLSYKKTARLSEIDINNHVNNTNYFAYAQDCLSKQDYDKTIKALEIRFNQELHLGDELELYYKEIDNQRYIIGKNQQKEVFFALITLND